MNLRNYLRNVFYDANGIQIYTKYQERILHIIDVRGWSFLQKHFDTKQQAIDFQDKLGDWIVEAIQEKIEREDVEDFFATNLEKGLEREVVERPNKGGQHVAVIPRKIKLRHDALQATIFVDGMRSQLKNYEAGKEMLKTLARVKKVHRK